MKHPTENNLRLSRQQVREIDRRSIEEYHVPGIVLMENAARAAADAASQMLGKISRRRSPSVRVICGGGNNGGDGLAVARHLYSRGAHVAVYCTIDPSRYHGDALINWRIAEAMRLLAGAASAQVLASPCDLLIDAIFGTGLSEPPRGEFTELANTMNAQGAPILAIDLPSGLDCDTGKPLGPACIRAARTITFVAEKLGFRNRASRRYTGDVTVGDIGCPRKLLRGV